MRKLISIFLLVFYLILLGGDAVSHIHQHEEETCFEGGEHICDSEYEYHSCLLCTVVHGESVTSANNVELATLPNGEMSFEYTSSDVMAADHVYRPTRAPPIV